MAKLKLGCKAEFPGLKANNHKVTSPNTNSYNCIAWAAGDASRWWWPARGYFWPAGAPMMETVAAFEQIFSMQGYKPCADSRYEPGIEKIAIYAIQNRPTHAARQIGKNRWTSKIGRDADIEHALMAIAGDVYGQPVKFMARPRNGV